MSKHDRGPADAWNDGAHIHPDNSLQAWLMAKCPDCGLDLSKFGPRHRCTTKIAGARKPTRLEADKIAKGEMSPADLLPKDKPASSQPAGRLAPRLAAVPISQPHQSEGRITCADVLAAIADLRQLIEALRSDLQRTDA